MKIVEQIKGLFMRPFPVSLLYQVEEGGFWAEVASEREFVIGRVKVAAVV